MEMESEEEGHAPRAFLYVAGAVMLLVGVLVASVFVFRLQPGYVPPEAVTPSSHPGAATIAMPAGVGVDTSLNFSPVNATVIVGLNNTVIWVNEDTSPHTVVSKSVPDGAQPFASQVMAKGDRFNVTLAVPGIYRYFCSIHPVWMQASITVKAAPSSNPSVHSAGGVLVTLPSGVGSDITLSYIPSRVTVVLGINSTVTWVNTDSAIHTVTALDNSFNSGNIAHGASFAFTFTKAGSYDYSCNYHSWMKGTVVVKAAG